MAIVAQSAKAKIPHSPLEVLFAFVKLCITSFGGPIAHIGYFREALAGRRRDEIALAGFVLLTAWRTPPRIVVTIGAYGGVASARGMP